MKLYIRVAIIVFSSTLIILLVSRLCLKGYYKFNYQHQLKPIEEAISGSTDYDIIFLGTSRTFYQVDPKVIDSISHQNSYNFGTNAGRLTEINMMLKLYLEHHKPPKTVVFDLTMLTLNVQQKQFFNPNRYYPFLDDTIVYNTISSANKKAWLYKNIPAFRITEIDDFGKGVAIMGIIGKVDNETAPLYKGYVARGTSSIKPCHDRRIDSTKFVFTEKTESLLNEIANICKSKNISLILTYSPTYDCFEYSDDHAAFFEYVKRFSEKNDVPFWNYEKWMSANNNYFADAEHLNQQGSRAFSKLLITDILKNK